MPVTPRSRRRSRWPLALVMFVAVVLVAAACGQGEKATVTVAGGGTTSIVDLGNPVESTTTTAGEDTTTTAYEETTTTAEETTTTAEETTTSTTRVVVPPAPHPTVSTMPDASKLPACRAGTTASACRIVMQPACDWQYQNLGTHPHTFNAADAYSIKCLDSGDRQIGGLDLDGYCGSLRGIYISAANIRDASSWVCLERA